VVGAPNYASTGRVYVFTWSGTDWHATAKIDGTVAHGGFGVSVEISGMTMVVGDPNQSQPGRAYLFTKGATGWQQGAQLEDPRVPARAPASKDRLPMRPSALPSPFRAALSRSARRRTRWHPAAHTFSPGQPGLGAVGGDEGPHFLRGTDPRTRCSFGQHRLGGRRSFGLRVHQVR